MITITLQNHQEKMDIRLDSKQNIATALTALQNHGKIAGHLAFDYYLSKSNQNLISAYKSLATQQIYDGDVLVGISEEGE